MLRRLIVVMSGLLGFLLVAEVACRLLPVSTSTETGYTLDPDILTYPPHFTWRVATGWDLRNTQTLHSNNLGFAADRDFLPDPNAVALIGDSYIEASMLPAPERPGAQLERLLGGQRPVYAMGSPGTSLLDYAERVRYARDRLKVRQVVLFVARGDLRQSACGSGQVNGPCLDAVTHRPGHDRRPPPSASKRALRHSALAQYLVSQLKLSPADVFRLFSRRAAAPSRQQTPGAAARPGSGVSIEQAVWQAFVERLGPLGPDFSVLIVVDGRHQHLDKPLSAADAAEREVLVTGARALGADVVMAESAYAAHYAGSSRSLDVGPYDGHLNGTGVRVAMQAVATALR
jgi:hypothetical protein